MSHTSRKQEHHTGHHDNRTHAVRLVPGDWKKLFGKEHFYTVTAECLNTCVYNKNMHIHGYVITYNSICLLIGNGDKVHEKLTAFYDEIKKAILKQRRHAGYNDAENEITLYHLFRSYRILNTALKHLLVGKDVNLPYYNPQVARLKQWLKCQPFCSVIDYTGAKGPVAVTKPEHNHELHFTQIGIADIKDEYLLE